MKVTKAQRSQIKVPILLMGASGSGKTLSALLIAKGMLEKIQPDLEEAKQWENIGVIDTEHQRSSLYVNTEHDGVTIGSFTKVDLEAPFTADRYEEAFTLLKQAGCQVIIIDSTSSAWSGEGGILNKVDEYGGQIGDWKKVGPDQQKLLNLLTRNDVHVIATARSKQGVEVTRTDTGKVKVEKVGLKPEMKDGTEYEFAITFQLYENHIAQAMKDNSSIFAQPQVLDREVGRKIVSWAELGVDLVAKMRERKIKAQDAIVKMTTESQAVLLKLAALELKLGKPELKDWTMDELTKGYKYLAGVKAKEAAQSAAQQKTEAQA
ncbi:ATP-binding protein [Lacticaseibacillus parakribbianus]|uniref:ATP-binding protein n=1 Tax=Lacticaseibacillus parakribbianus TaxID=2970927 RepID=UPI0021CB265D|nr:ATP-binding protein [Lacticaseibacillus parakribbianus]